MLTGRGVESIGRGQSGPIRERFFSRRSTGEKPSQLTHVQTRDGEHPTISPIITPLRERNAFGLPRAIEGAEFIPLAPLNQSLRMEGGATSRGNTTIEYTAGGAGRASRSPRKLARSAIDGYGERFMGGPQHIVHIAQDMFHHPERALAQGIYTAAEFAGMLASKAIRDTIEEAGLGPIEAIFIGKRLTIGVNPKTKHFGLYWRKMGIIERLAVGFELALVYDAANIAIGLGKDIAYGIGQIFTARRALKGGPQNGYSIKEGRVITPPTPPTFV